MKINFVPLFLLLLICVPVLAQEADDNGSVLSAQTARMMKTAGFWISRHPAPDAVIMGPETIDRFNDGLRDEKKLTKDIFTLVDDFKMESLVGDLEKIFSDIASKGYYTAGGLRNDEDFMANVKRNINLSGVVIGMAPRYGLVVHYASQRFLPTRQGLYETKGDYDFDQLQNSALDVGTPVAVVHTSADGLWYYVLTAISDGWVEAGAVALGDISRVRQFAKQNDFAVVVRPKADIFLNETMTQDYDYVRMGVRLPLSAVDAGRVTVNIPVRDSDGSLAVKEAYMNAEDVNPGFLAFTPRNIYKQAFMMLNQPYGWGDMYGEQDCSRFLQMVFATVGIDLPRDSGPQAQAGRSSVEFDETSDDDVKIAAIAASPAAGTLLAMKGHIMLYLGTVDGKPYAIHDTTSYKKRVDQKEVAYDVGRVIVSDLSLGQGSQKGSLLRRLSRTVVIE
jgi:hypothetical protein